MCIEAKGYKLARFTDRHVSTLCTEDVISCIKEICQKSLLKGKTIHDTIDIPLTLITSKVKDRYGFHLPRLLLKKSNKIKRIKIEKLFDENYDIDDLIKVYISDYI